MRINRASLFFFVAATAFAFSCKLHKQQKTAPAPSDGVVRKYVSKPVKNPVTVKLSNGLEYTITSMGNGPATQKGDQLKVLYTGKLTNDTVFDATSRRNNQPYPFFLCKGAVIPGWDSVFIHLHGGDKVTMRIPPALGYGSYQNGNIPANSTLIFDAELVDIVPPPSPWNAAGKDTITTQDGLKIVMFETHKDSVMPKKGQLVSVHYSGFLSDGTLFDSSVQRNQPYQFPIGMGRVIKGWDEGIMLLHKGDKAKLIIPYPLGYGSRGYPGVIPPNSTLVFDVQLVDVK